MNKNEPNNPSEKKESSSQEKIVTVKKKKPAPKKPASRKKPLLFQKYKHQPLEDVWLTVGEVSAWLGLNDRYFFKHLKNGEFPNAFLTETRDKENNLRKSSQGGVWRIPWSDVINFILEKREQTSKELGIKFEVKKSVWDKITLKTQWFSVKEVTAKLNLWKGTVNKMLKTNRFPRSFLTYIGEGSDKKITTKKNYGIWRIPDCDLILFLEKQKEESRKVLEVSHRQTKDKNKERPDKKIVKGKKIKKIRRIKKNDK